MEIKKYCLGKYTFETRECMQCEHSFECKTIKNNKTKQFRIEKYSKCEGCLNILYCHERPSSCMGSEINCTGSCSYDCQMQCRIVYFKKKKNINVKVIESVKIGAYNDYNGHSGITLKEGQTYKGIIEDKFLYILAGDVYKIFNLEYSIYKNYIEISEK